MKKTAMIMSIVLALCLFAGCGDKKATSDASANVAGTLPEIMVKLYDGVKAELPKTMDMEITEENSEMFLGVAKSEYKEALASDAMINAVAHSVCLVRANSADEAAALAKTIEEKADPRKWICVEAEKKIVTTKGDLVVLIMTYADAAAEIEANFNKL